MLPRLFAGAAALSLVYLVLAHEHRNARVRRSYRFGDAGAGFDIVSDVITLEYELFGVESKLEQRGDWAIVRTSRRGHGAIEAALGASDERASVAVLN